MNTPVSDIEAREKAATPLTDEEYAVWKGNIEAIAEMKDGPWYKREGGKFILVQQPHGIDPTMTTTVGIQLRLFATIDTLLAQLKDREEKLEAARGKVSMIDASPAGSLNAQLKQEALDILKGGE